MKPFKLLTLICGLIVICNAPYANAQDTTKKAKPVVKKAPDYKKPVATTPVAGSAPIPAVTAPVQKRLTYIQPTVPVDKSLRGQYQYLLTKVYNYQQPLVSALFKNYNDTLTAIRHQLKQAQTTLSAQTKTIDTLKASATNKDKSLAESRAKVDEVSLLGIPLTKATYNLIMWGLVITFGVIAAIVILRSGSHSREAKYRIKLYNELDEEYKNFKAKANEKEKKLARELQTERNKLDELLGNG